MLTFNREQVEGCTVPLLSPEAVKPLLSIVAAFWSNLVNTEVCHRDKEAVGKVVVLLGGLVIFTCVPCRVNNFLIQDIP